MTDRKLDFQALSADEVAAQGSVPRIVKKVRCATRLLCAFALLMLVACADRAKPLDEKRKKSESGDAAARYNLGLMYAEGEGVPKDYTEAVKWFRLAADQGDVDGQYNVGYAYANGYGVPKDEAEAVKWFRLVAEKGLSKGQLGLGIMYANGHGVPKDDAEAVKWFRLAAEQGLSEGQFGLGIMYANGHGVPKDLVQAHAWLNIAGASGHEDGKNRRALAEKEMTSQQRAEAMKLAREMFARIEAKKK